MTPEQKQDEILEILYGINPMVIRLNNEIPALSARIGSLEVMSGKHSVSLSNQGKDIDSLGSKIRTHMDDSESHSGISADTLRWNWTTAISVVTLFILLVSMLMRHG